MYKNQSKIYLKSANIFNYVSKKNIKWMNDPDVNEYLTSKGDFTIIKAINYYYKNKYKNILLAIFFRKTHIGNCGFFNINNSEAELRIAIGEKQFWGKGLGQIVISKMIICGIDSKINKIWLYVNDQNKRAISLYEKTGFRLLDDKQYSLEGVLQNKMVKNI